MNTVLGICHIILNYPNLKYNFMWNIMCSFNHSCSQKTNSTMTSCSKDYKHFQEENLSNQTRWPYELRSCSWTKQWLDADWQVSINTLDIIIHLSINTLAKEWELFELKDITGKRTTKSKFAMYKCRREIRRRLQLIRTAFHLEKQSQILFMS